MPKRWTPRALVVAKTKELLDAGADSDTIARTLGIQRDSILAAIRRAGDDDLYARLLRPPPTWTHGSLRAYRRGCRCEPCTDANNLAFVAARDRRIASGKSIPHGPLGRLNYGCTCVTCVTADRTRNRERSRAVPQHEAHHYRHEWTGPELEIACKLVDGRRYAYTAAEVARMLGRTVSAVDYARQKARRDPRTIALAGLTSRGTP